MTTIRIYLAGPIAGVPDYKKRFAAAGQKIREAVKKIEDFEVVILNPAVLPAGLTKEDYMMIDLQMVRTADIVILTPGWDTSTGAKIEKLFCQYIEKEVAELDAFVYSLEQYRKRHGGKDNANV